MTNIQRSNSGESQRLPLEGNPGTTKGTALKYVFIATIILVFGGLLSMVFLLDHPDSITPAYVVYNSTLYTMDPSHIDEYTKYLEDPSATITPYTSFVVGSNGRIFDVGTDTSILTNPLYSILPRVNMHQKVVLPGFIDAHAHTVPLGLMANEVDVSQAGSKVEVLELIQAFLASHDLSPHKDPGYFITGGRWDQNRWADSTELPTAQDLDVLFPTIPLVLMRVDYHAIWANTAAMNILGDLIPDTDPEGGQIIRDKDGKPTGIFLDNAMNMFTTHPYAVVPTHVRIQAIQEAIRESNKYGVTTLHDAHFYHEDYYTSKDMITQGRSKVVPPYDSVTNIAHTHDGFPIRIVGMLDVGTSCKQIPTGLDCPPGFPNHDIITGSKPKHRRVLKASSATTTTTSSSSSIVHPYFMLPSILDGDITRVSMPAAKLVLDGALGSRGAALLEPYSDMPDNKGILYYNTTYLYNVFSYLLKHEYQICTHMIGDHAFRQYLDIWDMLHNNITNIEYFRHRLEHLQITTAEDMAKLSQYPFVPSMQPTHATSDMIYAEQRLGKARLQHAYAWKEALERTGTMAFGTDAPIESLNPYRTLHSAVTMMNETSQPPGGWLPTHTLTRYQSLTAMTWGAAYAARQEHLVGSISKNKAADFIVLNQDVMKCPEDQILQSKALATFIDGNAVFVSAEELQPYTKDGTAEDWYSIDETPQSKQKKKRKQYDELSMQHTHAHKYSMKHLEQNNKSYTSGLLPTSPCLQQASVQDYMYRLNKRNNN